METTVGLSQGGRIVIPAEIRAELGLKTGTRLVLRVDGRSLSLAPIDEAIDALQARAAALLGNGPPLVEELLADRHTEAQADSGPTPRE